MTAKEAVIAKRKRLQEWDKVLLFVEEHAEQFDTIGITPNIYQEDQIDIDHPTREQVLTAIKTFPGEWQKEKHGTTMSYTLKHPYGIRIRLWAAELPPSCSVVKKTVVVPAQPERVEEIEEIVCEVA